MRRSKSNRDISQDIHLSNNPANNPANINKTPDIKQEIKRLLKLHRKVWTQEQAELEFHIVTSPAYGIVIAKRNDGAFGTLEYTEYNDGTRLYFRFRQRQTKLKRY